MSGLTRVTAADLAAYAAMLEYMRRDLASDPDLRTLVYFVDMTAEVAEQERHRRLAEEHAAAAA